MVAIPQTASPRSPRVKLAGAVLVLVRMDNGQQITAKLHQLSLTGGMLWVERPLCEAIRLELLFHFGSTTIRNRARTFFPVWATTGYLQPFEFTGLSPADREKLKGDLQKLLAP